MEENLSLEIVLVCLGCANKIQTLVAYTTKIHSSQFWKLQVHDQDAGEVRLWWEPFCSCRLRTPAGVLTGKSRGTLWGLFHVSIRH